MTKEEGLNLMVSEDGVNNAVRDAVMPVCKLFFDTGWRMSSINATVKARAFLSSLFESMESDGYIEKDMTNKVLSAFDELMSDDSKIVSKD